MGYVIADVAVTYSALPGELLKQPIKHFFWMASQMERVKADRDSRHLQLLAYTNQLGDGKQLEELATALSEQRGQVYTWGPQTGETQVVNLDDQLDPDFDRSGLHALKSRHHL